MEACSLHRSRGSQRAGSRVGAGSAPTRSVHGCSRHSRRSAVRIGATAGRLTILLWCGRYLISATHIAWAYLRHMTIPLRPCRLGERQCAAPCCTGGLRLRAWHLREGRGHLRLAARHAGGDAAGGHRRRQGALYACNLRCASIIASLTTTAASSLDRCTPLSVAFQQLVIGFVVDWAGDQCGPPETVTAALWPCSDGRSALALQRPVVSVASRGAQQTVPRVGDVVTAKVRTGFPLLHCMAWPARAPACGAPRLKHLSDGWDTGVGMPSVVGLFRCTVPTVACSSGLLAPVHGRQELRHPIERCCGRRRPRSSVSDAVAFLRRSQS